MKSNRMPQWIYITLAVSGLLLVLGLIVYMVSLSSLITMDPEIPDGLGMDAVLWIVIADLLVAGIAGLVFIIIEGRRLHMRWWLYLSLALFLPLAYVFPLFLYKREQCLYRMQLPD